MAPLAAVPTQILLFQLEGWYSQPQSPLGAKTGRHPPRALGKQPALHSSNAYTKHLRNSTQHPQKSDTMLSATTANLLQGTAKETLPWRAESLNGGTHV